VPSQQLQGQLQTQHSVNTSNYIMDKHNNAKKQTNKRNNNNSNSNNNNSNNNNSNEFLFMYMQIIIINNNYSILYKTIEENVPGSEYFNVPAENISSWCTSSRGTIFTWGADIEQRKASDIPSRNSETNNFQNGRAEFDNNNNDSVL
jgi:hypothetical protein